VQLKLANGTSLILKSLMLKEGCTIKKVNTPDYGIIDAVHISESYPERLPRGYSS